MNRGTFYPELFLRIGVFGTFLGHGIFAIGVKASWIPFLTTVGFSESSAITLMPVIGVIDVFIACMALIWPIRIVLIYAIIWAFATALMRPISGDSFLDFVERAANWAVPLTLLAIQGFPKKIKDIFSVRN
jgi:hypothetical protein